MEGSGQLRSLKSAIFQSKIKTQKKGTNLTSSTKKPDFLTAFIQKALVSTRTKTVACNQNRHNFLIRNISI